MSLATRKIQISRDVIFHEKIFPFVLSSENSIFPSTSKSCSTDFCEPCDTLLNNHLDVIDDHTTLSLNPTSPRSSPTTQTELPNPPIPQRKSNRVVKTPHHLKDYVLSLPKLKTNSNSVSNINTISNSNLASNTFLNKHHYISPEVIASKSQVLVESICCDSEPCS